MIVRRRFENELPEPRFGDAEPPAELATPAMRQHAAAILPEPPEKRLAALPERPTHRLAPFQGSAPSSLAAVPEVDLAIAESSARLERQLPAKNARQNRRRQPSEGWLGQCHRLRGAAECSIPVIDQSEPLAARREVPQGSAKNVRGREVESASRPLGVIAQHPSHPPRGLRCLDLDPEQALHREAHRELARPPGRRPRGAAPSVCATRQSEGEHRRKESSQRARPSLDCSQRSARCLERNAG